MIFSSTFFAICQVVSALWKCARNCVFAVFVMVGEQSCYVQLCGSLVSDLARRSVTGRSAHIIHTTKSPNSQSATSLVGENEGMVSAEVVGQKRKAGRSFLRRLRRKRQRLQQTQDDMRASLANFYLPRSRILYSYWYRRKPGFRKSHVLLQGKVSLLSAGMSFCMLYLRSGDMWLDIFSRELVGEAQRGMEQKLFPPINKEALLPLHKLPSVLRLMLRRARRVHFAKLLQDHCSIPAMKGVQEAQTTGQKGKRLVLAFDVCNAFGR